MNRRFKTFAKTVAATVVAAAATFSATPAKADQTVDWTKILGELDHMVRTGSTEAPQLKYETKRQTPQLTIGDPSPQNMGNAWFGVAPKVSLVARDWSSSTRLAGDKQLGMVESLRLANSTRMVVGRVRLDHARFTPFVQVGLGQWRVDRRYVPTMPLSVEVAGQLGAGFELRISRRVQIAAEATATTLIRYDVNNHQPQNVLWSALIASRVQF